MPFYIFEFVFLVLYMFLLVLYPFCTFNMFFYSFPFFFEEHHPELKRAEMSQQHGEAIEVTDETQIPD